MTEACGSSLVDQNAERFKALSNPVRLNILRLLVQGPEDGTVVGEIQERIGIPGSTLSHHLACLASTDLVLVHREGAFLKYRAHFPVLRALTEYLWQDCCAGGTQAPPPEDRPEKCCGAEKRRR